MRRIITSLSALVLTGLVFALAVAQGPDGGKGKKGGNALVDKMMAFNKKKDGKLTKEEVTDERLHRLFDLADANKDGVVTKEELEALVAKMGGDDEERPGKGKGGKGKKGKGGFGGEGGFPGKGGKGGFGKGGFGPPRPGTVLPPHLVEMLELTDSQKKKLEALQKDVDEKLGKILTDEQKEKLKDFRPGGPGGFGPGGGPGGPGGPGGGRRPGGPPPDDE